MAGATDTVLTITASITLHGRLYRAVVKNSCGSVETNPSTLTVAQPPIISREPVDQSLCVGDTARFVVSASGSGLTYRWQEDQGAAYSDLAATLPYQGTTSPQLVLAPVKAGMNGYQYRCIVSGPCPPDAMTLSARVTVIPAPSIASQPTQ
ncbi:MAG: hypothetical protein IPP94_14890 [Ignavibacteria bacterium]|nr:hypothetical protein [Ignavibacteria bacterium]